MGLDMYLCATFYSGGGYEHIWQSPVPSAVRQTTLFDGVLSGIGTSRTGWLDRYPEGTSLTVSLTVAYWRKANAVHGWFVREVQGGYDDCGKYPVSRDQLTQLRDLCQSVLDAGTGEGMPTQSGFFFGGTDYDDWYHQSLRDTVTQVDAVLSDPLLRAADFVYQSSW